MQEKSHHSLTFIVELLLTFKFVLLFHYFRALLCCFCFGFFSISTENVPNLAASWTFPPPPKKKFNTVQLGWALALAVALTWSPFQGLWSFVWPQALDTHPDIR